jgi:hypothetical protein
MLRVTNLKSQLKQMTSQHLPYNTKTSAYLGSEALHKLASTFRSNFNKGINLITECPS